MVDYTLGLSEWLPPCTHRLVGQPTPVAVILLPQNQDDYEQRSVQSVCRLQIDYSEQGIVDEGLARPPRTQAKPPSVAEARCCPLVIIPRRLSYHRRWALAPLSASAWLFLALFLVLVKDSWFCPWSLVLALVFSSLRLSLERRLDKTSLACRRQHSLPERIACTVLGRTPPACPSQSLSSCRFAPGQPIALHTHTHTNSGKHPP